MTDRKATSGNPPDSQGQQGDKGQQNQQRPPGDQRSSKGDRGRAAKKGGARNATSTGGQQQGGPGSAPFERADHANDGGSPKNN